MEEVATGYGLIEGPVWDDARGLIFSDVVNGGVWALSEDGRVENIVPKRRGVGGMALHADGGLVLSGRDVIFQAFDGSTMSTLLTNEVTEEAVGFNDLTTDREGRVWVGSMAFRVLAGEAVRPGHLHVIDLDGSVRTVSDGIALTNGLGFSPDGRTLYHSDSRSELVRAYEVTEDGGVSGWREFVRVSGGVPDGLAVAEDGSVWVALAYGGKVLAFEPDGSLRLELTVPMPMVASVCFGGETLRELYIVTGSTDGPRENCGTIYRIDAPVPGLPLPPARVRNIEPATGV
ncbi:MAG: SMP-30/gluconolactonase/LRE family protein [bacterium]